VLLERLYRQGPAILGFFEGADSHEICAHLTGTAPRIWLNNECDLLIQKRVQSYMVLAQTILILYILMLAGGASIQLTKILILFFVRKYFAGVGAQPLREPGRVSFDGGQSKMFRLAECARDG